MPTETEPTPENIKRLREKLGLTQRELAERLNVDVSSVARWEDESKKTRPTGTAAAVLAALIGSSVVGLTAVPLIGAAMGAFGLYRMLRNAFEGSEKNKEE